MKKIRISFHSAAMLAMAAIVMVCLQACTKTDNPSTPKGDNSPLPASFDFKNNPMGWPVSTDITDYETGKVTELTVNGVKLTAIQNNEWIGNILYKGENDAQSMFRVGKLNAFKLTAPEGAALSAIMVDMATEGQSFDFTPSNGVVANNLWTGNATEVTFTTAANRQIAHINIVLKDEDEETIKPAAYETEAANIAAFNAIEDGKVVKLTLTDARVNGVNGGNSYVEDASGATVVKGVDLKAGTKLNGYMIGTKSTNHEIDYMGYEPAPYETQLTATDASKFEATTATMTGSVKTITEAAAQANYGKLITIENVTISGGGQNKTLKDAQNNTIKARDYMGVLPTDYTWPAKASSITGVVVYYMTGWFIMPISAQSIVAE